MKGKIIYIISLLISVGITAGVFMFIINSREIYHTSLENNYKSEIESIKAEYDVAVSSNAALLEEAEHYKEIYVKELERSTSFQNELYTLKNNSKLFNLLETTFSSSSFGKFDSPFYSLKVGEVITVSGSYNTQATSSPELSCDAGVEIYGPGDNLPISTNEKTGRFSFPITSYKAGVYTISIANPTNLGTVTLVDSCSVIIYVYE